MSKTKGNVVDPLDITERARAGRQRRFRSESRRCSRSAAGLCVPRGRRCEAAISTQTVRIFVAARRARSGKYDRRSWLSHANQQDAAVKKSKRAEWAESFNHSLREK